jgi:hypothetical protein
MNDFWVWYLAVLFLSALAGASLWFLIHDTSLPNAIFLMITLGSTAVTLLGKPKL